MNDNRATYHLNKLSRRYLLVRWLEAFLFAGVSACLVFFVFSILLPLISIIASLFTLTLTLLLQGLQQRLFSSNPRPIVEHLNNSYPAFEESADLLTTNPNSLTSLQQIQLAKVSRELEEFRGNIQIPNRLSLAIVLFALCTISAIGIQFIGGKSTSAATTAESKKVTAATSTKIESVGLNQPTIRITPPLYTQQHPITIHHYPLEVLEGSNVEWDLSFDKTIINVLLVFNGKDSLRTPIRDGGLWTFKRTLKDAGFYQIICSGASNESKASDYFKIDVVKDQAPQVTSDSPSLVSDLDFSRNLSITIRANIADDYGLTDAHIVATVAKGNGEAVKFREDTFRFDTPTAVEGLRIKAEKTISLNSLDMGPGDELYFYIEASDNKYPVLQKTRTETKFIKIKDTLRTSNVFASDMGVDIMPEYFRSQRQIIIDSEKLLEEQKHNSVSIHDFKQRSNDLASDQKALRLRYGQFMGEEEEAGGLENEESSKDQPVEKQFGHPHDSENHQDDTQSIPGHTNADGPTLLQQSIKTKLKVALTLMWDAELHLRLASPLKSLPFQYRILRLLKEISNDSRVYVRRTGFEPPPVKEEKRLKGDLSDIRNSSQSLNSSSATSYPYTRQSIRIIEELLGNEKSKLSPPDRKTLQQSGNELSGALLERPELNLNSLKLLKSLISDELSNNRSSALTEIRRTFWRMIPDKPSSPTRSQNSVTPLDRAFTKNIESLSQ